MRQLSVMAGISFVRYWTFPQCATSYTCWAFFPPFLVEGRGQRTTTQLVQYLLFFLGELHSLVGRIQPAPQDSQLPWPWSMDYKSISCTATETFYQAEKETENDTQTNVTFVWLSVLLKEENSLSVIWLLLQIAVLKTYDIAHWPQIPPNWKDMLS